jgi:hypothetical protein
MKRYRKGAEAKTSPDKSKNLFLPKMSESEAAGRLTKIPGIVEAARTMPVHASGVPRLVEKVDSTEPLLDIVELRITSPPIRQRLQKTAFLLFVLPNSIGEPA